MMPKKDDKNQMWDVTLSEYKSSAPYRGSESTTIFKCKISVPDGRSPVRAAKKLAGWSHRCTTRVWRDCYTVFPHEFACLVMSITPDDTRGEK